MTGGFLQIVGNVNGLDIYAMLKDYLKAIAL